MSFELWVALRYLRAKRRQAVIGVVTGISVVGVAAGVAALIVALAITNGMRRDLQERLLGSTAHVELMRVAADGIRDWRPLVARLSTLPHVTAAAPGFYGQVLISHGARSGGALIKGVIPAEENLVSDLLREVKSGSAAALEPTHRNEAAMNGAPKRTDFSPGERGAEPEGEDAFGRDHHVAAAGIRIRRRASSGTGQAADECALAAAR